MSLERVDVSPDRYTPDPIRRLREVLPALDNEADALIEAGDYATLAYGYHGLTRLIADLQELKKKVGEGAAVAMPDKTAEVPGLGVVERHRSADRKNWDSDGIVSEIRKRAQRPDPETGEIVTDPDALLEALKAAAPFTASMQWRVKALKDMGFQVDEWCSVKKGRETIQIHGGDK